MSDLRAVDLPVRAVPTQVAHPARATVRTVFQAAVSAAAMAPVVYTAITSDSPETAVGAAAGFLAVCGAITRVMALPGIDDWLARYLPVLSAEG